MIIIDDKYQKNIREFTTMIKRGSRNIWIVVYNVLPSVLIVVLREMWDHQIVTFTTISTV